VLGGDKMIETGGPLLYHGGEDQQDRLIPPAESSGGSSSKLPDDARRPPQISQTRLPGKAIYTGSTMDAERQLLH
jgi:hypothetical protein